MSTKVKSGDSINIPEGCKAVIEDGKVIFQPEFKDSDYVPKRGDIVVCTYHVPYTSYGETVTAICTGHRDKYDRYDCFVIYEHGGIIKRNKGIPVEKNTIRTSQRYVLLLTRRKKSCSTR